jgi:hypothetical protein
MDAITMPSMRSLLPKLQRDFPQFTFEAGDDYFWSPSQQAVSYGSDGNLPLLFHELAHGILDHREYRRDIELLSLEAAAWQTAIETAKKYGLVVSDDAVQDHLDTYREWMHARSTCPSCEAVGYQENRQGYACVACGQRWRVNDARVCGLKRYALTN